MDGAPREHQRTGRPGGYGGWLRARSDSELAVLLSARPDLLAPVPVDSNVLASRATGRRSLDRALDSLDRFTLQVIGALVSADGPVTIARLGQALQFPREPLQRSVDALCARGLAWSTGEKLRPAPGLGAVIGETAAPVAPDRVTPAPPPLQVKQNGQGMVDQAAAGAAVDAVHAVEELLGRWADDPPPVLRAGGVGIRQLRRTAAVLDVPVPVAALYAETARAAGLLASTGWTDGDWLPTGRYDSWRGCGPAEQWAALAGAWLAMRRVPALTGYRDDRGRLLNALGGGLDRLDAPAIRATVLGELATAGGSVEAGSLLRRLDWLLPRRQGAAFTTLAEATLREAASLGVTGLGALAAHGRALEASAPAADGLAAAAAALSAVLPEPVGHVLLQADLTAVAPGPLVPELAAEFSLMAAVESTGGGTVYRFSAASVRRALDAGRSGGELLAVLERNSATPVPQPLRYLIEDLARRHGRVRAGAASGYVRCDDPSVIAEIAADQRAARLRLRQLAPTVLASPSDRDVLLATLRELGYAPAAEAADGTTLVSVPAARRAKAPPGAPASATGFPASAGGFPAGPGVIPARRAPAGPDDEIVRAAVRELRAGDEAASAVRRVPGGIAADPFGGQDGQRVAAMISALTTAAVAGQRIWIGFVDSAGVARNRILKPERVEGGYLTAYDTARAVVHRLALHRVTGLAVLDHAADSGPEPVPRPPHLEAGGGTG